VTTHSRSLTHEGNLVYGVHDEIRGGKRGGAGLEAIPIPDRQRGGRQVEADLIAAIRSERPVTHTDFVTGARYMQFTEAVARSSPHQVPITLPLREFSNPSLPGSSCPIQLRFLCREGSASLKQRSLRGTAAHLVVLKAGPKTRRMR
jgi:hypothetical protein